MQDLNFFYSCDLCVSLLVLNKNYCDKIMHLSTCVLHSLGWVHKEKIKGDMIYIHSVHAISTLHDCILTALNKD